MLLSTQWLDDHLADPDLRVVDMRWRTDGSARGHFEQRHIPGAVYLDWTTDIVEPDHSIAFMLASPERFREAMESRGVGDDSTVVAYADGFGSGPFRLWWASRVYGHDGVGILDGGFEKWIAEGRPTSTEANVPERATWTPRTGKRHVATAADVERARDLADTVVLDSRPPEQFRGDTVWFESGPVPADPDGIARTPRGELRAGHVPWAANVPASDLYNPDLTLKSPDELRRIFARAGAEPAKRAITYCGVGISAAALVYALDRAGIEANLYDASWEEWGRDPDRPVARG